jgi:hypothetical protein
MLISPTVGIIFVGFVALLLWRDKLAIFKGSNLSNLLLIALLPTYAPDVEIVGIAAVAPPANMANIPAMFL